MALVELPDTATNGAGPQNGNGSHFEPDDLGIEAFRRSYAASSDETWADGSKRVAAHVASAEEGEKRSRYEQRFYSEIAEGRFMPGGRVWYGSGRPKAQLLNCFVVPTADSREGWGDTLRETLIISGTGGGVGINFSPIRPRGEDVKGTGGHATGAVSLMRMLDSMGGELVAGGGRRMAMMFALGVTHPDLPEFLNCKLEDGRLSNANVSVMMTMDPTDFAELVKNDDDIELEWLGRKTGGKLSARKLWNRVVENAWFRGEPGVLNSHLANEMNNISYHDELICTNPCGEIWLEPYGCCCLGALVLPRFVQHGELNWEKLEESIRLAVRFLDDVLTVNHYPFDRIKQNCEDVRRIGMGVMGLHTMLLELGMKYSSSEAHAFVDRLFSFIKHTSYDTSINLAIEKGPFPAYKPEFCDSGFMQTMKPAIRRKVLEYGIRNCALLTIAPTGTTGIVQGVSTGIEPYMAPVYWRRIKGVDDDLNSKIDEVLVIEPAYDQYGDLVEGAADLTPRDHFEMQRIVQRHIDNAVSKTINLPSDYPVEELAELWLEYLPYVKGTTFYRWGSRENEPFKPVLHDEIEHTIMTTSSSKIRRKQRTREQAAMDCVSGACEITR
jgi:ribonucleoside-diphosphate reductase alpha chain